MIELPKTPSYRLEGKRALVVGASSGIGLGCATALAEAGAHVTLSARRADRLTEIAKTMQAKGWGAAELPLNAADVGSIRDAISQAEPFDILLNAAGLARHTPATGTETEDFDAVMGINVRGAYFLAQAVANRLIQAKRKGSIITISSQMGHVGGQDRAVYCASKHAVEGFTKAMAIEWGPHGIRINTICPTFILTELTKPTFEDPEKRAWVENKIKLGRAGEVEDIMGAAVYLASDASALVTGTSLLIDGGWTAD
ncbi:MAG: SDR family NAD(P)-dependent oxidoreductase [Rhizobiaceae bacterium]